MIFSNFAEVSYIWVFSYFYGQNKCKIRGSVWRMCSNKIVYLGQNKLLYLDWLFMCNLELLKNSPLFVFWKKNHMWLQNGFDHIVPGRFAFHLSLMVTITLFWCKFVSANLDMGIMYFFHFTFFFHFHFILACFPKSYNSIHENQRHCILL